MLVEVGHRNANDGYVVTQTRVTDEKNEDGTSLAPYIIGTDAIEVKTHLFDNPGLVTRLPGNTAILDVVRPIRKRLDGPAYWVSVSAEDRNIAEAEDFERFLAEFFQCDRGKPEDVETNYWTLHGNVTYAPGETPGEQS